MKQFGAWVTGLRGRLASRFLRATFATEILQSQKLFISNVAHELRTPLSTIKTVSEVSLLDPALARETRRSFVEITEELNRVSEILDNLLSLNALGNPETLPLRHLDYGATVEEVVRKLQPLARKRGVRLTLRAQVGAIVYGNRAGLEQIAHHITKNALAFTPAEGAVAVRLRPEGEHVVLEVQDSGIGMSQEEVAHLFEPFYRADTSRNRSVEHSGSGLGLTIVHEMVRMHGGTIRIDSKKRHGTTVVVLLPRGGFIPHSADVR